jgi:hypothetical protein
MNSQEKNRGLELLNLSPAIITTDAIAGSAQSGDVPLQEHLYDSVKQCHQAYIGDGAVLNIRGNINIESKSYVNAKALVVQMLCL